MESPPGCWGHFAGVGETAGGGTAGARVPMTADRRPLTDPFDWQPARPDRQITSTIRLKVESFIPISIPLPPESR